jgi:NAD(P)-dependent dehydrogenase (short-subunit alcohol dehydrogenase family)
MKLQGARTVIIGGGGGMGAAIARRLGGLGAQVIVADIDLASAEAVARDIQSNGSRARAVAADLAVGSDLDALFAEASDWLSGRVDLLINHAGVAVGAVGSGGIAELDRVAARPNHPRLTQRNER